MDFFKNRYNLLEWPIQSPYLNIIKHLQYHLKHEVRQYSPINIAELKEVVLKFWNKISSKLCRKLFYTIPKRIETFLRSNGRNTSF